MGNICYHNLQDPYVERQPISDRRSSRLNLTTSTENPLTTNGNQYKENVISEMNQKKINPNRFCRQSKVIVEQREQSVYTRDTENRQENLSEISGNYETVNLVNCQSAAVSTFIHNQQIGQKLRIGDTVLLKNLKEKAFLHCKYQRLKKLNKQNVVKLEKKKDELNEMYLTWRLLHESNSEKDEEGKDILNQQKIKIQHCLTGCYLQTSKSYQFEQSLALGSNGQIVSCGKPNKITTDQIWQLECLNPGQQYLSVNDLFRIKHIQTETYFASYQQQVCCLDECDVERHRIFRQSDHVYESGVLSEIQNNSELNQNENNTDISHGDKNEDNILNQRNKDKNKEYQIIKLDNHNLDEEMIDEIGNQSIIEQDNIQHQNIQKKKKLKQWKKKEEEKKKKKL